ncbi:MAG: ATP-binding protein [Rhodospirillaceae bacterium]|nr:ATP-binding protein [Rhodospirillaceae bacterium]
MKFAPVPDRLLERRFLMPAFAALFFAFAALGGVVLYAAARQDRLAADQTAAIVAALVKQQRADIERLALDYTWWDGAIANLLVNLNPTWANDNFGWYLRDTFNVAFSLVLDEDDRFVYAAWNGERRESNPLEGHLAELSAGFADVRRIDPAAPRGASGIFVVDGAIYLVGFGAITPERTSGGGAIGRRGVAAIGRRLDQALMETLGAEFRIADLSISAAGAEAGAATARGLDTQMLPDLLGRPAAVLSWSSPRPSREWLALTVPGLVLLFLVVAVLALRVYAVWRETLTSLLTREMQLRVAIDAADTANRAKSSFLANMSHELRTPLNAIIGFSSIMTEQMMGPIGSQRYREYAKDIQATSRFLLSIINELLDLARIEAERTELADDTLPAADAAAEALRLARGEFAQARFVEDLTAARGVIVRADRTKLIQILTNLLTNAAKASPPGGEVRIAAAMSDDGGVRFDIVDSGPGVDEDTVQTLFTPFSRGSRSYGYRYGYGIGLAVSRKLADMHDAKLTLASQSGRGTVATLALPPARVLTAGAPAAARG